LRALPEGKASGYWSTLGANLLEGEMALMNGDTETAVRLMAPSVQRIHEMGGGSREQKDIFQDVLLALQRRLGNVDAVIELAQRRLQRNPNHFQSLAAMAWAYEQTGKTSLQQQTYQEIVDRAEQAPVSTQAPAFVEAQEALHSL
jgi:tetratricopeptide (TPR) repeat protein